MEWKDKMIWVIESTLNEGREDINPFKVIIIDSHNVELNYKEFYEEETITSKWEYLHDLESHWRMVAEEIVKQVFLNRFRAKLKVV